MTISWVVSVTGVSDVPSPISGGVAMDCFRVTVVFAVSADVFFPASAETADAVAFSGIGVAAAVDVSDKVSTDSPASAFVSVAADLGLAAESIADTVASDIPDDDDNGMDVWTTAFSALSVVQGAAREQGKGRGNAEVKGFARGKRPNKKGEGKQ